MSPSVDPFNEAKYEALMDGLDFQEINKSEIENGFTLGAEYYGQKYVEAVKKVELCKSTQPLGKMWMLMTDGDHGSPDYQDSGVLYLLSESIEEGYINTAKCRYITVEKNNELKRSCLHPGDIVVTKTGVYFGKSAVIPETIPEANTIAHVGKITLKEQYNPYYVSTFLNSKYGYYQMRRRGIKATRPEIKLVEFPEILVPLFSHSFDLKIEKLIREGISVINESFLHIKKCEKFLMSVLNLDISNINQQPSPCISECSLSHSLFSSGRLDAEYYQTKYDKYLSALHKFTTTSLPEEFEVFKNVGTNYADGISDIGVIKTKQLTNTGLNIESIESYFTNEDCVHNKSTFISKNDVIFASMGVGSLGKVSLFSYEGDKQFVTDSTLRIYRAKETTRVLPEVLCIFLQSPVGQELIYRYVVGSTGIINIYDEDIAKIPIPVLDMSIQKDIAEKLQESFALRHQAKLLLEYAKRAVEMAIEQGEDVALEWVKNIIPDQEV